MISIALRNLAAEKFRFLISVGGVAFSVMLILIILGLYQGWRFKAIEYIQNVDTDLWVSQEGAADITNSASIIPLSVGAQIEKMDGVVEVNKFIGRSTVLQVGGQEVNAFVVGLDTNKNVAGPRKILQGKALPDTGEIIVDQVLARKQKLALGDKIDVFDKTFKVVGISQGANMFVFQFSFIKQEEMIQALKANQFVNFYLVKVNPGKLEVVKDEINKIAGIAAFSRDEFVAKNRKTIEDVFLPIITVLVAISVLVGTAVIGLTIYTATIEKAREYGVLKALGGTNWQIYQIIFVQALIFGFVGYFLGVALTYVSLAIIPNFVPAFVTFVRTVDLTWVFGLALGMSFLASYVPVRSIVRIDPALVFK